MYERFKFTGDNPENWKAPHGESLYLVSLSIYDGHSAHPISIIVNDVRSGAGLDDVDDDGNIRLPIANINVPLDANGNVIPFTLTFPTIPCAEIEIDCVGPTRWDWQIEAGVGFEQKEMAPADPELVQDPPEWSTPNPPEMNINQEPQ